MKFKQVNGGLYISEPGVTQAQKGTQAIERSSSHLQINFTHVRTHIQAEKEGWMKKTRTGSKLLLLSKNKQVLLLVGFLRGSLNHVNRLSTSFPTCRQGYPTITFVCPPRRVCQLRVNQILFQPSFSRHCSGHLRKLGWDSKMRKKTVISLTPRKAEIYPGGKRE